MNDPMGKAYLKNQRVGRNIITFENWPENYNNFNLAVVKYEWWILRHKYFKMMKLGEEVVKILDKEE